MNSDKPTKTEDEYFAREDAEKAKRLKEKLKQEILEEQKKNIKDILHETYGIFV
ncbi:MAG: zf-TFIIB protein, partial [Candidatus Dadabacteria bacterium]|nr:zf-TFIIB protein [Candidatus Dadabacteria bacterium]